MYCDTFLLILHMWDWSKLDRLWLPRSPCFGDVLPLVLSILRLSARHTNAQCSPTRCCPLQLSKASMGPPASAMAALGGGVLFLGSWAGDSLLVRATQQQTKVGHGNTCSCPVCFAPNDVR
jgi:hypothetical protein